MVFLFLFFFLLRPGSIAYRPPGRRTLYGPVHRCWLEAQIFEGVDESQEVMELRGRRGRLRTGTAVPREPGAGSDGPQGSLPGAGGLGWERTLPRGVPTPLCRAVCPCSRGQEGTAEQGKLRWEEATASLLSSANRNSLTAQPVEEGWEGNLDAREMPAAPLPCSLALLPACLGLLVGELGDLPSKGRATRKDFCHHWATLRLW